MQYKEFEEAKWDGLQKDESGNVAVGAFRASGDRVHVRHLYLLHDLPRCRGGAQGPEHDAGRKSPLATKNLLEVTDGLRRPPATP